MGDVLLPLVTTLLLSLVHVPAARAERWTPPLAGLAVVREFDFDAHLPFVRGAHRGVLLAGTPGAVVRAPCSGRVTFSGRHPRLGPGLTLRCGALAATVFGLEAPPGRHGVALLAGTPVGRLRRAGTLYFGARRAGDRWGYRDPLALLATGGAPAPLAPAPRRRRRVPRHPVTPPGVPPRTAPHAAPLAAWAGLAVAGAAAGAGVRLRRRGARTRHREAARRAGSGQRTH